MALKFRSWSLYLHIPLHIFFISGAILGKEKIQEHSFKPYTVMVKIFFFFFFASEMLEIQA